MEAAEAAQMIASHILVVPLQGHSTQQLERSCHLSCLLLNVTSLLGQGIGTSALSLDMLQQPALST